MINQFFECLVPVSACNLKCEYCYVIQENRRNILTPKYSYTLKEWENAIRIDRIGKSFFSFCGYGETLIISEPIISIIKKTLESGHIVNITCNGTITDSINLLHDFPNEYQERLLLSFSLHYDELKKRNLLDIFADNVKKTMQTDISCFVQINLCDSYISKIDEIKDYCIENFGCLPQVALTRKEINNKSIEIYSDFNLEEYKKYGEAFKSKLFDYTCKNYNVKRKEFCHAGESSYCLDLSNGDIRRCYAEAPIINIFDDIQTGLPKIPIGCHCKSVYCLNSSHFLSQGNIANFRGEENYISLRNRENGWIKNEVEKELSCQFSYPDWRIEEFDKNDSYVIYGAGKAAREVIKYLLSKNIYIEYIIVNSRDCNPVEINGIKVFTYLEKKNELSDKSIAICIKNYKEIKKVRSMISEDNANSVFDYYYFAIRDDFDDNLE